MFRGYAVRKRFSLGIDKALVGVFLPITTLTVMAIIYLSKRSKKLEEKINNSIGEVVNAIVSIVTYPKQLMLSIQQIKQAIASGTIVMTSSNTSNLEATRESILLSSTRDLEAREDSISLSSDDVDSNGEPVEKLDIISDYIKNCQKNVALNIIVFLYFMVEDITSMSKYADSAVEWYLLFPLIPALIVLKVSTAVISVARYDKIKCKRAVAHQVHCNCCNNKVITFLATLRTIASTVNPIILTTLPVFIIYHSFWILIVTAAFPARTALSALFFGPLISSVILYTLISKYFVKLLYNSFFRAEEFENSGKKLDTLVEKLPHVQWWRHQYARIKKHEKINKCIQLVIISAEKLCFVPFWVCLLAFLYKYSDALLDIGSVQDDLLKAIVLAAIVVGVAHRLSLICRIGKIKCTYLDDDELHAEINEGLNADDFPA